MKAIFAAAGTLLILNQTHAAISMDLSLPQPFEERTCAEYLTQSAPPPEALRDAVEIVRWIALSHPILERAIAATDDRRVQFGLAHLAPGFYPQPPAESSRSFARRVFNRTVEAYDRDDAGRDSEFDRAKGDEVLARRSVRINLVSAEGEDTPERRATRLRVTADLCRASSVLLRAFIKPRAEQHTGDGHKFSDLRVDFAFNDGDGQRVTLEWHAEIPRPDLARLKTLNKALTRDDVRAAVVRLTHDHLDEILDHHREACRLLDLGESAAEAAASFASLERPSFLTSSVVDAFLDEPRPALPATLGAEWLNAYYFDLQRLVSTLNAVVGRIASLRDLRLNGPTWPARLDDRGETELGHLLDRTHADAKRAFTGLRRATTAIEALRGWLSRESDQLNRRLRQPGATDHFTDFEAEFLSVVMASSRTVAESLAAAQTAIERREAITLRRADQTARIRIHLGHLMNERVAGRTGPARDELIRALEESGEP